ncbi:MAG: gliding motility-associated C-terminal domain-containing protein [Flavobacteriales bacterium]|nr:gliding motility-associated C-terminal domain-containing protein [Flavobacteriales bacterium]
MRRLLAAIAVPGLLPLHAQLLPEFNMADTTVTLCKGILLDSEEGPGGNIYGNNEDLVFTIDAGSTITLVFEPTFCLEQGLDLLTFHDGPSITSPQIGPAYSGIVAPPPIIATSGQLTIHFVSDENVAYCGFEAQWTSVAEPPVPPVMSVPVAPLCAASGITLQFSYPIPCDSIDPGAFVVTGSGDPAVTGAMPVTCTGGETSTVLLGIDPPFDRNCPYTVAFTLGLKDRCDSLWYFTLTANTQVTTCPLGVLLEVADDTLCAGTCTTLFADVQGCLTYTFSWDQGITGGAGPHTICPTSTTTYTVQVTENGTGQTATGSVTVLVDDPQIAALPATVCQSAAPFDLQATPPGGWWSGAGVLDSLLGTFEPDTAGPGTHVLTYTLPGGCADAITLVVDSMDASFTHAACPGSAPFQLPEATPMGGTWSGPYVQPNGLFDPAVAGAYLLTYTAGACSDTVTVNVGDIVAQTQLDTVCQSTWPFAIAAQPFGGRWRGPGIVDSIQGVFDPDEAGGGDHVIDYVLHGCDVQFTIHVKPVDIGGGHSACPSQGLFTLSPAPVPPGGLWSGDGIVDPVAGTYDPVQAGMGWDELTYAAPNGCVDTIGILVGWTELNDDTLFFCAGDDALVLNEQSTGRTPWDGIWSGPGIGTNADGDPVFDPNTAGIGVHVLHYDANTCGDTMLAIVHPAQLVPDQFTACSADAPFLLASVPPGADWQGTATSPSGSFDPAAAGEGTHVVHFTTPAGCADSVTVTVLLFQQASISGVEDTYCSNDVLVDVALEPPGGVLTGLTDTLFNPAQLADGTYTIVYTVGSGNCQSSASFTFTDHPALTTQVDVSTSTICEDGGSSITVNTSGGLPGGFISHQWSDGLFPVPTQNVQPVATTTYIVATTDGCSDPVVDSITITVHPPFQEAFTFSAMQCYGEAGHVAGSVSGDGTYTFSWATVPPQTGDSIALPAGTVVNVEVTNDQTGCAHDTLIQIPSWPAVTALFSPNPDEPCVPWEQREVTFIDLSLNATGGYWVIAGDTLPYAWGTDPQYEHGVAGTYNVQLVVWNDGGCTDSLGMDICIRDSEAVFVPDAFSPNGDGLNDILFARAPAALELEFAVYDRWGAQVFRSTTTDHGWDGTADGALSPSGVYLYTLRARLDDGAMEERTGNITLVR